LRTSARPLLQIAFRARVVVHVRFRDLGQAAIRPPFLLERLLQQPRLVRPVQAVRIRPGTAIRRDFVVFDPLERAGHLVLDVEQLGELGKIKSLERIEGYVLISRRRELTQAACPGDG
jgi:hypothetical protein